MQSSFMGRGFEGDNGACVDCILYVVSGIWRSMDVTQLQRWMLFLWLPWLHLKCIQKFIVCLFMGLLTLVWFGLRFGILRFS